MTFSMDFTSTAVSIFRMDFPIVGQSSDISDFLGSKGSIFTLLGLKSRPGTRKTDCKELGYMLTRMTSEIVLSFSKRREVT